MSRLPFAAKTLIAQVTEKFPDVEVTQGEPDGLRVRRSIGFDPITSEYLAPILLEINDPRIADLRWHKDDGLTVTFVPTGAADINLRFPLEAAEQVIEAQDAEVLDHVTPENTPPTKPAKRTARKASSK